MKTYQPHRSSLGGLDANIMALLCYLVTTIAGFIPVIRYVAFLLPFVIVFVEKESGLVRFHAMQAFMLNLVSMALSVVLGILLSVLGVSLAFFSWSATAGVAAITGIISLVIGIAAIVFSILAMIKAYNYTEYDIPLLGALSRSFLTKFPPTTY